MSERKPNAPAQAMAEANIRDVEEQAGLEKQAAVAAVVEKAAQLCLRIGGMNGHNLAKDIRSLANTDALSKVKAQERLEEARWWRSRWFDKFECVENLDRRIAELQQAMEKVKEKAR